MDLKEDKDAPKIPVTFRLSQDKHARLKELAEESRRTTSALMDQAIEEFLDRHLIQDVRVENEEACLDAEDIRKVGPVIEAMGTPVPLSLFLKIVRLQKTRTGE